MRTTIASLLLVLLVGLSGCDQDKGNYDYHALNEPVITGVADSMSVLIHDRLSLSPSLGDNITDTAAYTFQWKAINRTGEQEEIVVGETRTLDREVTLDAGEYLLYFTMTERRSGLFWRKAYALTVSDPTSEGWMVLCSDGGKARLDVVSTVTGKTYADVLRDNGMDELHGPRAIQYLASNTDSESPFYLFADDGATRLSKNNFGWKKEYLFKYEVAQSLDLRPTSITMAGGGIGKVVVSDSRAHYAQSMGIQGLYGSAVNKDFRIAPYVGANIGATSYAAVYLFYDTDNKRFMAYCPLMAADDLGGENPVQTMDDMGAIATTRHPDAGVTGTAFSAYPEGMDFVYMENTKYDPGNARMGTTYTVLRRDGQFLLYGIQLGDLLLFADCTFVLGKAYYGDLSGCTDIARAEHFAFSSLRSYMYYAVGGAVYRVNLSETPLKAERQFGYANETVTRLKFNIRQTASQRDYDLIVASQDAGGAGTLRIYDGMATEGDFSRVTPKAYTGFARIVDVTYRERTN